MSNKNLLILGAGIDQIVGILKAKEMGFYTICLDGNAKAEGRKYCDEFHAVSIKHIEQIEDFIEHSLTRKVDGVIAFGVDIPYNISFVAEKLKINYTIPLQSAKISEDKFMSKQFMQQHNIAIPRYKLVKTLSEIEKFIEQFGYPVILKPVDNSASRGISFLKSSKNLRKYYQYALENSRKKEIIIEQYLSGCQISTESFVINNKVYNIGFADRNYSDMEKFLPHIIENGADMPSLYMKNKHKKELEKYLQTIAKKLNIKNGIIKGDIVIYNNKVYIIEFALRLSGGNFSTIAIPHSTGIDFIKIAIKLHANMFISDEEIKIYSNNCISWRYKFLEDVGQGIVKSIKVSNEHSNLIGHSLFIKNGDRIVSSRTSSHAERLACVIMEGKSRKEAIRKCEKFLNKIEVEVE